MFLSLVEIVKILEVIKTKKNIETIFSKVYIFLHH